jgi:hypothetical protein
MDPDANKLGSIYHSFDNYYLIFLSLAVGVPGNNIPTVPEELESYAAMPYLIFNN